MATRSANIAAIAPSAVHHLCSMIQESACAPELRFDGSLDIGVGSSSTNPSSSALSAYAESVAA